MIKTRLTYIDWAEALYLEGYLNDGDKKIILRIQRLAEMAYRSNDNTFIQARIEVSLETLAKRLKVSVPVANALSCFEVTA